MKSTLTLLAWLAMPLSLVAQGIDDIVPPGAELKREATGFKFVEGPLWKDGQLYFSDIPANTIYLLKDGAGEVWLTPSGSTNGNTLDREGRWISCEHDGRVVRRNADGTTEVIASEYDGKPLNSPNDVVVKSDGTIWFTDPTYGLRKRPEMQSARGLYRFDPKDSKLTRVAEGFGQPNGLCFSPDEKLLYVADSGPVKQVEVFNVGPDGTLTGRRVFASITPGNPDGMRCDAVGRLFVTAGDGVQIFAPNGTKMGTIQLPESPANLCFGGADGRTLYMTARTSVYSLPLKPLAK